MSQTHWGTRSLTPLETEPGGWAVGWTMFAGVTMVVQGCWWFIAGLVTLLHDEFSVVGEEYISQLAITTLGWIHLLVGLVILAAGSRASRAPRGHT